jgi:AraC family transcriptional regulator, positive regulator of tynA and feaB
MRTAPTAFNTRSSAIHWSASPGSTAGKNNPAVDHWSSDAYRPSEARTVWLDRFARRFGNVARDNVPYDRPFRLRMEGYVLGNMGVSFVETLWSRLCRASPNNAAGNSDMYWLFQPRSGATVCRVQRGEFIVRPGECFLFDLAEPFALECNEPSAGVSLTFPKQWLARWLTRPERCSPHFPNSGDWSSALCSVIGTLHPESISRLPVPGATLAENVAILLTLAAGPDSQPRSLPLLESVRSTLNGSLHEPGLSASRVAELHHISLRTLHYTFANARTTFLQELLRMRLERAQEILSDESLSTLEIAEVADRCGFADPSHFARRFRQRFGEAPVQFRRSLRKKI